MTSFPIREDCIIGGLGMELYHSQAVCDAPSFSSSNLRLMDQRSPAHMYAHWSGNPNRVEEESKPLNFGSAAHALILGDEAFETRHVVSPFKDFSTIETIEDVMWKPRRPDEPDQAASKQTWSNYRKVMDAHAAGEIEFKSDWKRAQEEAGRRVITPEDFGHIKNMAEVLAAHPVAQDGVLQGEIEQSVFHKDERGFWVKSRMDCRPLGDTLADFKTAADASEWGCEAAVRKNGYDQQFALGAELLLKVAGQKVYAHLAIFQEKKPPYAVMPYPISPQAIWRAAQRNERAKRDIATCLKDGDWPGYIPSEGYFPPKRLEDLWTRDEEAGLLPPPPAWLEELKESA